MVISNQMEQTPFVGDGQFVGDGGHTLQLLWESTKWRMIKGCPGRYIIKHKKTNPVTIGGTPVTALDASSFLIASIGHLPAQVHDLQSEKCADRVQVAVFPDSGGVITYCKMEASDDGPIATYIHTLNTASGLQRKLEGLRLDYVLK